MEAVQIIYATTTWNAYEDTWYVVPTGKVLILSWWGSEEMNWVRVSSNWNDYNIWFPHVWDYPTWKWLIFTAWQHIYVKTLNNAANTFLCWELVDEA